MIKKGVTKLECGCCVYMINDRLDNGLKHPQGLWKGKFLTICDEHKSLKNKVYKWGKDGICYWPTYGGQEGEKIKKAIKVKQQA